MQAFLVGGAVRDQLLGRPVAEKDWVVIGETPDSMQRMGFRPVGKDFPVFLHPKTQEEYALARTERKTAPGYKGFAVYAAPDVTLEEDLIRRDLTINAMAMTPEGIVIDPHNGRQDLRQRILRHVSPAFAEDPVRILRIARFSARYAKLNFMVAPETLALMQAMVQAGEVDHLVPERVWAELYKALTEQTPSAFFYALKACGALNSIFPEIEALFGVPQPPKYHPEIDTGVHALLSLDQAASLSPLPEVRFAALVHDLGKALSPKETLPHHHGHESKGLPLLANLCDRLRVPNAFRALAQQVMQYHTHSHRAAELRPSVLTDLLASLGAFKPTSTLSAFLLACEADAKGRTGLEDDPYPQAALIKRAAAAAAAVDTSAVLKQALLGPQIGEAIRQLRIRAVAEVVNADKALQGNCATMTTKHH
jgi:tRNA nucleotidyltransferase (CCA-adding enzyme)